MEEGNLTQTTLRPILHMLDRKVDFIEARLILELGENGKVRVRTGLMEE